MQSIVELESTTDGAVDIGARSPRQIQEPIAAAVDAETLARASSPGWALEARLGLTDACGGPRCASVRLPTVAWQAVPMP